MSVTISVPGNGPICGHCKDSAWLEAGWPRGAFGIDAARRTYRIDADLEPPVMKRLEARLRALPTPDASPELHDHATLLRFVAAQGEKAFVADMTTAVEKAFESLVPRERLLALIDDLKRKV